MKKRIISFFNIIVLLSCLISSVINFNANAETANQSEADGGMVSTGNDYDYGSYPQARTITLGVNVTF